MELTSLTLDEFLCSDHAEIIPAPADSFQDTQSGHAAMPGPLIRTLGQGYSIHEIINQPGDVILCFEGSPVGFYMGDLVAVDAKHQGRSLSVPMVIEGVRHRALPAKRTMSVQGRSAFTKAWRVANGLDPDPWP